MGKSGNKNSTITRLPKWARVFGGQVNLALTLLGIAILINVFQFYQTEKAIGKNKPYNALTYYRHDDLEVIGLNFSGTVRGRIMPWAALSRVAPHSRVLVPADTYHPHTPPVTKIYGQGRADEVVYVEVVKGQSALDAFDPTPFLVASGENGDPRFYFFVIAMDHVIPFEDLDILGPALRVSPEVIDEDGSEFLLTTWAGPAQPFSPKADVNDDRPYYLLVETSLIPEVKFKEVDK